MAFAAYWMMLKGDTTQHVPQTSRFQSQQVTPTTTPKVSTVKPPQYEKGSTQSSTPAAAVKPGTTPPSGAGGAVGNTTMQKGTTQVKQQATIPKPSPPTGSKIPPVSSGITGTTVGADTKPTVSAKAQSTIPQSKSGPVKVDPPVLKPQASTGLPGSLKEKSGQKVEVEVGPSAPKGSAEVDPFDALSDTLPSSQPVAPKVPKYTGPEVREGNIKVEKAALVGEKDSTLPPGYRWADLEKKNPPGPPEKPKEVPKPLSTEDALESLSAGFVSAPPPSAPKKTELKTETVGAVDAKSAGFSNFAPPPYSQQKQQATTHPSTRSPAPPADKKAKIEKPGENSSLAAGKSSAPAQPAKPKTDVPDSSMSTDALSDLGDMLGDPEPPKKQPELKPGQIVDERKVTSEKGVRVGERDDTLPPGYRFSEEELKKFPPPPVEPSLDADEALDFLSGGFTTPTAAPIVKAAVPPSAPSAQGKNSAGVPEKAKNVPKVDELSALDFLDGDFVAPAKSANKVSSAVPPGPKQKQQTDEDAFDTLGDMLGAPEPPKKQPELKPKDIVHEDNVTSKKGVRVGEREDTLPPGYRFSEEELKKYPAPPKEPSLNTDDAMDLLSDDFGSPFTPPAAKLPVCTAVKPPAKPADDFVAPSSASKVQCAVTSPTHTERQLSDDSAFDALSDTLGDIKPPTKPESPLPKFIVKEKDVLEERISKPGERDDSLPPDHRFSEADKKAFAEAKDKCVKPKEGSMDDTSALDLLSSDFSSVPTVKASAPETYTFIPEPVPPTHTAPCKALDELADKLIPNLEKGKDSKSKGKGGKPKSKSKQKQSEDDSSAVEHLSGQLSTKVVPSSSTKGGKR
ncbi:calpastatin-like isoform X4 [Triplophysa dalaica]|uniref:calpastatin-like isoform X4 n=1 Tax=Triplophysa dalaica TaxID=1582913 RepID=UPI0024DF6858|nr:calpastatin-like isoform X4 [Triplophysa dalaica]